MLIRRGGRTCHADVGHGQITTGRPIFTGIPRLDLTIRSTRLVRLADRWPSGKILGSTFEATSISAFS
ncbi:MAG TPA: hypothetical protein VGK58_13065, partial [Lacipirellulaceae bacterium]